MKFIVHLLRNELVKVAVIVIALLITSIVLISFWINHTMEQNHRMTVEADRILENNKQIGRNINLLDLGVRGYALTKEPALLAPYYEGYKNMQPCINVSRASIKKHGFSSKELDAFNTAVKDYIRFCEGMIGLINKDSLNDLKTQLKEDKGQRLWKIYLIYTNKMAAYEVKLKENANVRYNRAVHINSLLQISLFAIGIPSLLLILYQINRQQKHINGLVRNLLENNRRYLFNSGNEIDISSSEKVMEESITNIRSASEFINEIAKGNFEIDWPGLNEENKKINQETLAASLIDMRDKMRNVKEEDEKRLWATEGIARFSEIIRNHQSDEKSLCDEALRFMVKYMNAQQGNLFIRRMDKNETGYLELIACYAFERKKYKQKRIEPREGLIGQIFMEGETTMITDVPENYTEITSGMGGITPSCILIVPMKQNNSTEAIVEIAGFKVWEAYEVSFIEKCGEFLGSLIASVKIAERTNLLLKQSQIQAEQLRVQEEELRQNMEELAATNEEMKRKEEEVSRILATNHHDSNEEQE
jgi:CHASE3 domain sensor protein